jgi:xanthine dehydrogenase YagT iron-sulfur-binding subunit
MAGDGKSGKPRGLSRREFLRGSAVAGALGAGLLGVDADAAQRKRKRGKKKPAAPAAPRPEPVLGEVVGPGPVPMRFWINRRQIEATLEPRVTLLDALRDHLGLTGAKRVCDRGTCGSCTVLLDGKAVYACSILAIEAQGRAIQTVEGLGRADRLHPLQAAIVENDGQQCGFCTPGFVMAAKGLLDHNPTPSLAEIHDGLSGNVCRCGAYAGLRAAVLAVARAGGSESEEEPAEGDDRG